MALAGSAILAGLCLVLVALEVNFGATPATPGGSPGSGPLGPMATMFVVGGSPLEGKAAPAFTLLDGAGTAISLAAYRGRPVIVNFWASWCGPCKAEFPILAAARVRHADAGLEILGVVYDDSAASAAAFMASEGAAWPMLLDPQHVASTAYHVMAVPESFYIDPQGVVRTFSFGPPPASGIDSLLAQILPAAAITTPPKSASPSTSPSAGP